MRDPWLAVVSLLLVASAFAVTANGLDTWLPESLLPPRARHQDASIVSEEWLSSRRALAALKADELERTGRDSVAVGKSGRWQSNRAWRGAQPWAVQVRKDQATGAVEGEIHLSGSNLFTRGNIKGEIDGDAVSGVVVADDGSQLAVFHGSVTGGVMSGTYHTADGDSGDWEYADVRAGTEAPIAEWREAEVDEAKAKHRRGGT